MTAAPMPLSDSYRAWELLRARYGFIPNAFRVQSRLPRAVQAQADLLSAILVHARALSAFQREVIQLVVAAARGSAYWVRIQHEMLDASGIAAALVHLLNGEGGAQISADDRALLGFVLRLSEARLWDGSQEIQALRKAGFADESILEAVLVTALARMLCTVEAGCAPEPESNPPPFSPPEISPLAERVDSAGPPAGPYLRIVERNSSEFPPFADFERTFGAVPNIFRAQALDPDAIAAEAHAIALLLGPSDLLTHVQKQCILLVIAAAESNTYCIAEHSQILRGLGMAPEEADQVAVNHRHAGLAESDKLLLDAVLKIGVQSQRLNPADINALRQNGFTEAHIVEAVAVAGFGAFLNTVQKGLGVPPELERPRVVTASAPPQSPPSGMPSEAGAVTPGVAAREDPDATLVARVQNGDIDAFEDLVRRHNRRVYRVLLAILGNTEEAKDAMQDSFLKAFQHIAEFERRSRFSTWMVTIARNTALQRLRDRPKAQTINHEDVPAQDYRPQHLRSWADDPERLYSQSEMRKLIDDALHELPADYRVAIVLRDLEQLPTADVAAALGISIAGVKARIFRGRLMLRDLLAPHFTAEAGRNAP